MEKYRMETLEKINPRFIEVHHKLSDSDVNMANEFVELIGKSRSNSEPRPGDLVRYTNEYGDFYEDAHVESVQNEAIIICEMAHTYISKDSNDTQKICCISSGGSWNSIKKEKFKYAGTAKRTFWSLSHLGACAHGGIEFFAEVNVWECNLNRGVFSTKVYDKYYLDYAKNHPSGYHYFLAKSGTNWKAWHTKKDVQAWLRTFRAVVIPGNTVSTVWTYKEIQHLVSPDEFEKIQADRDVMLMNGKRYCKRVYDDERHTIHTYFVWYWKTYNYEEQNKIIKTYVSREKENQIALKELERKVKPIEKLFL